MDSCTGLDACEVEASKPATGRVSGLVTIAGDEYELLCTVFAGAIEVRDQGVQGFNRLPAGMRLAITTLATRYSEQGLDDRGLPTKDAVARFFGLARQRRWVPVTATTITDTEILELWRSGAIDTKERDLAVRKARKPHHAAWRLEARERCAKLLNARAAK